MLSVLQVENLGISFRKDKRYVKTVDGVSFSVKKGETLGLVGESGCGKSVTSLSIMGLLPAGDSMIEGSITFQDRELTELTPLEYAEIRGKELAMIFQEPMTSLNPVFTIGNQMMEAILEHQKITKKEAFAHAVEMLKKVGIPRAEDIMGEYPHQLSGGMRQRVMIAMAMSCNPKLLIADEPTTALDVTIQAQILDLMRQLKEEFQTSIIMITHDLGVVAEVCDRVLVMYAGKVVEEGTVREVFKNPKHPYTIGLMKAVPTLTEDAERLYAIPGSVPMPEEMPIGCRFAPRCCEARKDCFHKAPPSKEVSAGHYTSCWLHA
ncbi:ABC transporter ATP-binding protein [Brevibacillus massiliensis]|uniref:ABC transporter ATP-binding protein n=1 Tax=Brevibacillus massiliensis TaxID=1118054 RepID=UPI0002F177BC|nr:ABC transporter ATP-binding protein [Brevibacillus massiliensis]